MGTAGPPVPPVPVVAAAREGGRPQRGASAVPMLPKTWTAALTPGPAACMERPSPLLLPPPGTSRPPGAPGQGFPAGPLSPARASGPLEPRVRPHPREAGQKPRPEDPGSTRPSRPRALEISSNNDPQLLRIKCSLFAGQSSPCPGHPFPPSREMSFRVRCSFSHLAAGSWGLRVWSRGPCPAAVHNPGGGGLDRGLLSRDPRGGGPASASTALPAGGRAGPARAPGREGGASSSSRIRCLPRRPSFWFLSSAPWTSAPAPAVWRTGASRRPPFQAPPTTRPAGLPVGGEGGDAADTGVTRREDTHFLRKAAVSERRRGPVGAEGRPEVPGRPGRGRRMNWSGRASVIHRGPLLPGPLCSRFRAIPIRGPAWTRVKGPEFSFPGRHGDSGPIQAWPWACPSALHPGPPIPGPSVGRRPPGVWKGPPRAEA